MDSISTPDLDSTLKLLAGVDLIDRNGCKKNMDYMNTDIVLEVPDTPDRLPTVHSVDRSSGPSLGKEGIEGEADTSSSDGRMGHSRNSYDRRQKDSGSPNLDDSIIAVNDTDHLFRREAPATEFEFEKTRVSNESKKSAEIVDLSQKSPFPFSFPTRCRDSRRNNGKAPFRENKGSKNGTYAELFGNESSFPNRSIEKPENDIGLVFDWENAALKTGDKGKGIDLSSDPEVKIEQVPSRPLKLGVSQRKTGRRQLASNNYLSHCNTSKSRIQSEVDCQDITKSVDGETCSDSSTDPQAKAKPAQSRLFNPDASQRKTGQRRLTRHSYIHPCNIQPEVDDQTIIKTVDGETFSSFTGISAQDDRKNGDIYYASQPKTGQAPLCLTESNTGVRRPGPRGCTSPYNIRDKKVAEDDVVKPLVELRGGISSHQINIVSPNSEGSHADKKKGKVKLDANTVGNMQHVKAKTRSGRVFSTSGKEVTVIADIDDDTPGSSEDFGYRTTRNRREKSSRYPSHEIIRLSKREGINNYSSDQSHETSTGDRGFMNLVHESPEITISRHGVNPSPGRASSESESETRRRDRRHKFMKGKKRYSSLHFTSGESSSSVFGDSEISYLYSSGRGSNPKSTRTLNSQRHDTSLGPVIEVDDLHSPELRCHSAQEQSCRVNVSSVKATQVESDELLARQLQEQFYDESPGFGGTEEIDATIARSLQEEDARLAASIGRHSRSYSRDTSISHLYAYYPQMPSRNAPPRWTNRARVLTSNRVAQMSRNFSSPEMDIETTMLAHLRRNFNSAEMDVDTRLHFLEALEAAFDNNDDMAFSNNVLQIQRDFNENDYEMLLALDDNNHHVGASERQINSLPQSVIQSEGMEEACAICLETPADGEIIRHLPCLHKFHKDCIDTWLRRRTSCPICKSGINSP